MSNKITIARIKRKGKIFEIAVDLENALKYRKGENVTIHEVLISDFIFRDQRKGIKASREELIEAFETDDIYKIAEIILKEGELIVPVELKKEERVKKYKRLIEILSRYGKDAKTKLPIPPQRLKLALEQLKINIKESEPIETQLKDILAQLSKVLPIVVEKRKYRIIVPAQFVPRVYYLVEKSGDIVKEVWLKNGDWVVDIDIYLPVEEFILGKLAKLTNNLVDVRLREE